MIPERSHLDPEGPSRSGFVARWLLPAALALSFAAYLLTSHAVRELLRRVLAL